MWVTRDTRDTIKLLLLIINLKRVRPNACSLRFGVRCMSSRGGRGTGGSADPVGGVVLLARKRVGEELACLNCMRSSSTASQTWMSLMSKSP
jgi:hypothetical protein